MSLQLMPLPSNVTNSTINIVNGNQFNNSLHSSLSSDSRPPLVNNVPFKKYPSIHLRGRDEELELISRALETGYDPQHKGPTRCAIYAPKGFGKTQLILQFAKTYQEEQEESHLIWISARTDEEVIYSCRELWITVNPDKTFGDTDNLILTTLSWLESGTDRNWLLLFHDVTPETAEFLINKHFLPSKNSRGKILFTTDIQDVANKLAPNGKLHTRIALPVLKDDDAAKMLLDYLGWDLTDLDKAKKVIKYVSRVPIAVSFIAAYMNSIRQNLDNMLDSLGRGHRSQIFNQAVDIPGCGRQSLSNICASDLDKLEEQRRTISDFLKLLALFAPESIPLSIIIKQGTKAFCDRFLAPEDKVPLTPARKKGHSWLPKFLKKGSDSSQTVEVIDNSPRKSGPEPYLPSELVPVLGLIQSDRQLREAIVHLQAHAMVDCPHPGVLNMHDLYHIVVQDRLSHDKRIKKATLFDLAVNIVYMTFHTVPKPTSKEHSDRCEILIPHLTKFNDLYAQYIGVPLECLRKLMEINTRIAGYLHSQARYSEAEELYALALGKYKKHLPDEHSYAISVMSKHAALYESQEKLYEAEELYRDMLDLQLKAFTPEDPKVLATMHRLAAVLHRLGKNDEAEGLYEKVLAADKTLESDNLNPSTFATMEGLGQVYVSQCRFDEAQKILNRILDQDPDIPTKMHVMQDIAHIYIARVQFDESGNRLKNPNNVTSANRTYLSDAQALLEEVLQYQTTLHGPQHPETLTIKFELGQLYQTQNRYKDALAMFQEVLKDRQKHLGPKHPGTMRAKQGIARIHSLEGRDEEAKELLVEVLKYMEDLHGPDHRDTRSVRHDLGRAYRLLKEFHQAENLLHQVLVEDEKEFGPDHPNAVPTMNQLANVYLSTGRTTEGEELLGRVRRAKSARANNLPH